MTFYLEMISFVNKKQSTYKGKKPVVDDTESVQNVLHNVGRASDALVMRTVW